LPFWTPLQSSGQLSQSSPIAVSHAWFPQVGTLIAHSFGQLLQVSPASQTPSRSQILHPEVSMPEQSELHRSVPLPNP